MTTATKKEMITIDGLVKIDKAKIAETFSDVKKIQVFVEKVKTEVLVKDFDVKTKKGREEIASRAYRVSKLKNAVVKQIVDPSIAEAKEIVKNVGIGKKHWNAELELLRDKVRAPLNAWEAEEEEKEVNRITGIKDNIQGIVRLGFLSQVDINDKYYIMSMLDAVENIDVNDMFDEFTQEALQCKNEVKDKLSTALNALIQRELEEAQRKELAEQKAIFDEKVKIAALKEKAQERLNIIMMIPSTMFGKSSEDVQKKIKSLINQDVLESEFGELTPQANAAKQTSIDQLNAMYDQQLTIEKAEEKNRAAVQFEKENNDERIAEERGFENPAMDERDINSEPASTEQAASVTTQDVKFDIEELIIGLEHSVTNFDDVDTKSMFYQAAQTLKKTSKLLKQVMAGYKIAATIAEKEGYETRYEQDEILVNLLFSEN